MVKSLVDLCTAVCIRNVKDISDVGSIPYRIARPIINKIDSATQLRRIEVNSPHLESDTPEHWKRLIAREFPVLSRQNNFAPSNPRSWHKIYARYQRLDAEAKRAAEEQLKNAFREIAHERGQNLSQVVTYDSKKLPRLPRDVRPQVGIRARGGRRGGADQSELRFTGGSRTKTNTPKSLLKRAMREAKEISTRNRLNIPIAATPARPGQIARAPVAMVQEKVNSARPLRGIRPPSAPVRTQEPTERGREARLRKAKEASSAHEGGSYISDGDLEDDLDIESDDGRHVGLEVEDLEALFDDSEETSPSKAKPSRSGAASGSGAARGSVFARKMSGSSAAPRARATEAQTTQKAAPSKREPTGSAGRSLGPGSPPPKPQPAAASSSSSALPATGPSGPRKRKAVDIFMKPKPKMARS
ncbi:hypothetical protein F4802DRAFT_582432 [Xylaria palmicola]|nr:hypothetical protein F4802DRAFT_582432 [Xylaria palmicola]